MESEYILGNMDNFRHENKRRFGVHFYTEFNPLRSRHLGIPFIHFYTGRDYLNIRFDDVIWTMQAGITLNLEKYYPIGFKSIDSLVKEK